MNSNTEPISFDPHGDLQVEVGHDESRPIIFTVCSRTLARVSPVFEKMLFGNFKEARPKTSPWRIRLPADKVVPLAIFFHICHGQVHRVPKTLPIEDLYDLAVLTNYYDATPVLGPWVNEWMASIEDDARESQITLAKALWISWEFGRRELFMRIAHKLLLEANGPLGEGDEEFQDLRMPPDIIERIDAIRINTIKALLKIFHDMVETLIVVDEKPRWCRYAEWMGSHRCESMVLGSMTFCLARASLWPLPHPDDVTDSIIGLRRKMTSLIIHDIGRASESVDHHACNPERFLLERVELVIKQMESPVQEFDNQVLGENAHRLSQS